MNTVSRLATALLLSAAIPLAAGCGAEKKEAAARGPARGGGAEGPVEVRVAPAGRTAIERKVEFVGSLAATGQATVSAEVEGTVQEIRADLGDAVGRGQTLLTLVPDEFRYRSEQARSEVEQTAASLGVAPDAGTMEVEKTSAYRKALADYENARTDHERRRGLVEKNLIARKEADDAEARFRVAEANLAAAREQANTLFATLRGKRAAMDAAAKKVRDTQVRSPIAGAVEARLVSPGEYVRIGTPLFRIVNDRPVKLVGEVPEFHVPRLRRGQAVELWVDGHPGKTFRGTLARISPAANAASRAVQVEALFPNGARELRPGFFGKGAIRTATDPDGVTVPKEAIVTFAGIDKLFVVAGGKAQERRVKLGEDLGDRVEILEGVSAGEAVAVANIGKLASGTPVRAAGEAR